MINTFTVAQYLTLSYLEFQCAQLVFNMKSICKACESFFFLLDLRCLFKTHNGVFECAFYLKHTVIIEDIFQRVTGHAGDKL